VFAYFFVGIAPEEILIADNPAYGPRLAEWFVSRRFRTKVEIEPIDVKRFTRIGGDVPSSGFSTDPPRFGRSFGDLALCDEFTDEITADAPAELYELLRIEAGYGRFGVDFDNRTLPQEAGLARTLSVEKGCYVGQETVARLHYRGKPNRHLRGLRLSAPASQGEELLLGERTVGRVGSTALSLKLGPIALALVRREAEPGSIVSVGEHGANAEIAELPFTSPARERAPNR
jgi:folate-binding protein YgfZ